MTTVADYLAAAQDASWQEQSVSDAVQEFSAVIAKQDLEPSLVPHVEELRARARSLLLQKYEPPTVKPLAEFDAYMALNLITSYCPPSIRAEIEQLHAEFEQEKEEYKRISWQEEGKRTRPRSSERAAFNARQAEHLRQRQALVTGTALNILQAACGSAEEADLYIHMRWLQSHQENVRRNIREIMKLQAGEFLSRHMTGRASDTVSEVGTGTSRFRKYVDNGGILSPINDQALNDVSYPDED